MHIETAQDCGPPPSQEPGFGDVAPNMDADLAPNPVATGCNVLSDASVANMQKHGINKSADCEGVSVSEKKIEKKVTSSNKKMYRRRLFNNDEENTSPVLGLRIVPAAELKNATAPNATGTPSTASTESLHGSKFQCKLCQAAFSEPLQLANHKCVRIKSVQYDCSVCGKSFSCPANLASHRRWHKPKDSGDSRLDSENSTENKSDTESKGVPAEETTQSGKIAVVIPQGGVATTEAVAQEADTTKKNRPAFRCTVCRKKFRRRSYLKQHMATKHEKGTIRQTDELAKDAEWKAEPQSTQPVPAPPSGNRQMPQAPVHDFGGLAALAFAAEVHRRLSPHEYAALSPNLDLPSSRPVANRIDPPPPYTTTLQRETERKRKSPACVALQHEPSAKKHAGPTDSTPVWLPPSPPRSDLSCSPKSSSSEFGDDITEKTGLAKIEPVEPASSPLAYVSTRNPVSKPLATVAPATTVQTVKYLPNNANYLFSIPSEHSRKTDIPFSPFLHHPNGAMVKFQEPFHPYTYPDMQHAFRQARSATVSPAWNSWSAHAATAWKNLHHQIPVYLPSPVYHIPKS